MTTVEKYLRDNHLRYSRDENTLECLASRISSKNAHVVTYHRRECGHKKTCKVSTLYRGDGHCGSCELWEKYRYRVEDSEVWCDDCGYRSCRVPRTNLHKHKCLNCGTVPLSVEVHFFRNMVARNQGSFSISRSAQYPSTDRAKALTADYTVFTHNKEILVEIDDINHISARGSERHKEKDAIAAAHKIPLLRINTSAVWKYPDTIYRHIENLIQNLDVLDQDFAHPFILIADEDSREYYTHRNLDYNLHQPDDPENAGSFISYGGYNVTAFIADAIEIEEAYDGTIWMVEVHESELREAKAYERFNEAADILHTLKQYWSDEKYQMEKRELDSLMGISDSAEEEDASEDDSEEDASEEDASEDDSEEDASEEDASEECDSIDDEKHERLCVELSTRGEELSEFLETLAEDDPKHADGMIIFANVVKTLMVMACTKNKDTLEAIESALKVVTSFLLFNGVKIALTADQSVEEKEIEEAQEIE